MVASIAATALVLPVLSSASLPAAQAAGSLVRVDGVRFERDAGRARISATVQWNAGAVADFGMTVGDLRLVAVSEQGHLPVLLAADRYDVTSGQGRQVSFTLTDDRLLAAMRTGNRIVLTASQHQLAGQVTRSDRTYVTVAQVQPYGSPQPHVGTEDCSAIPVVPGAMLRYCDLVGAYLDGALVSIHDPRSSEGRRPSLSTRMERADLTGATAVRADFSGASLAGGRINGADLRNAKLDNLSLAGADAVELKARGATSDKDARDSAGDFFRANLTGADLRDTIFRGISVGRARLDGAQLQGASWQSFADGATFRRADLTGAQMGASTLAFADLSDATLKGSSLTDLQLAWAWLCRTTPPAGAAADGSRDCRQSIEPVHVPAPAPDQAAPFVAIDGASLSEGPGTRTVQARVTWNADSARSSGHGMTSGDLRLVAVDAATGIATVLHTKSYDVATAPSDYEVAIDDRAALAAMGRGSRIVLTATQHQPRPRSGGTTTRSYVTVSVLQRGPGLGRIGSLDCSRLALTSDSTRALDFCDLTGAMLDAAALRNRFMREADLSGATFRSSALTALTLDGSRLGSLQGAGATVTNVSLFDSWAPRMDLSASVIAGSRMFARTLDGTDFTRAKLVDTQLVATSLRRATFTNATLVHPDIAYTDLLSARMDGVDASTSHPSLFLANLTGADMSGSRWNVDESSDDPPTWATLCGTKVPSTTRGISGDRDCPR